MCLNIQSLLEQLCGKCIFCGIHHHHHHNRKPSEVIKRELTTIKQIHKKPADDLENVEYQIDNRVNVFITTKSENVQHFINIEDSQENRIELPLEYLNSIRSILADIG